MAGGNLTAARDWPCTTAITTATAIFFGVLVGNSSLVSADTLQESLATAYSTNPVILAARAELRAVDEQVPTALSNWRPTVQITGSAGKVGTNNKSVFFSSDENRTPRSAAAQLSQPIYRGGRTLAETKRADHRVLSWRARLKSTEQSVLMDAATAYMDVLRDMSVLDLSVKNESRLRRQLEAARDRFSVGEVTRTDVVQSEARVSNAVADRVRAQGDLDSSRDTYIRVIGVPPVNLQWPDPLADLPQSKEDATNQALNHNPDVLSAIYDGSAAADDVDLVLGEFLPSVSLDGSLETASETSSVDSVSKRAEFMATLTVPIYQAGLVSARAREAKEISAQRQREIDDAKRLVVEDASRAWEDLESNRAQVAAFSDSVRANKVALEGVEQEASVGLRTTLDVLDAEQELFEAEVDLVRARRNTDVAAFNLSAAVGTFNAVNLSLPVSIYDETEHYNDVRWKFWGGFFDD